MSRRNCGDGPLARSERTNSSQFRHLMKEAAINARLSSLVSSLLKCLRNVRNSFVIESCIILLGNSR